ncbi:MAG: hypothetical protein LC126_28725 [Bryobacterales bacterium]|nr:hypothetical protein [Bryobacterales bacterium]
MKITVLCTSREHPIWPRLEEWRGRTPHETSLAASVSEVTEGELLLLISCSDIIRRNVRDRFRRTLVIHAADVPHGRGFAPLNWQIIEGKSGITVTLMEAADKVDSGDVWAKRTMQFEGHELFDELFGRLFETELELMDFAVANFDTISPTPQSGEGSYYRRRVPEDSRIQPTQTIADVFDLVRVSDPSRYPAFFDYRGHRYALTLTKMGALSKS